MMRNGFYFILKALFILKMFKFLFWLFGYIQKTIWLKKQVNFKIYDVTARLTITIHILPNISLSMDKETNDILSVDKI